MTEPGFAATRVPCLVSSRAPSSDSRSGSWRSWPRATVVDHVRLEHQASALNGSAVAVGATIIAGAAAPQLRAPRRRRRLAKRNHFGHRQCSVTRQARPGEGYTWEEDGRHAHEVKIYVPVEDEVSARDVDFRLEPGGLLTIKVCRKGDTKAVLDREPLWGSIDLEDVEWMIEDHEGQRSIIATLTKLNVRESWEYLLKKEGAFVGPQPDLVNARTDWAVLDQMDHVQHLLQQHRLDEAQEVLRTMTAGHVEVTDGRIELVKTVNKGRGWRAAKEVKAGDVLLYDTAFCCSPCGESQYQAMGQQCMQKSDDPFFKGEVLKLTAADGSSGDLLGILKNNTFECSREPGHTALFVSAALFNHSCCPNAFLDSSQGSGIVRALRSISVGEEVCISYVPVSDRLEVRKGKLSVFGFTCRCQRCVDEDQNTDPQFTLPCVCGEASAFTVQPGAKAAQTCRQCGHEFDAIQGAQCLQEVRAMNAYAAEHLRQAKRKGSLDELGRMLEPMARAAVAPSPGKVVEPPLAPSPFGTESLNTSLRAPPRHPEVIQLLDNLAVCLYAAVARAETKPERKLAFARYWAYVERSLEARVENHGRWTNQRDVSYVRRLHQLLLDRLPSKGHRRTWTAKLSEICKVQFGQDDAPQKLVQDLRATEVV